MKQRVRLLAALAAVALAAAPLGGCGEKSRPAPPKPGQAPDFELSDLSGRTLRLSDYRGKVLLLDFWASWCPPCRQAIPHVVELQKAYGSKGLQSLGLNLDESREELAAFLSQVPVNYPMLRANETTRAAYGGVTAIPQIFLVDRQGRLRERYQGFTPEIGQKVKQSVEALLKEEG